MFKNLETNYPQHRIKTVYEGILYRDRKEESILNLHGIKEEGILNT